MLTQRCTGFDAVQTLRCAVCMLLYLNTACSSYHPTGAGTDDCYVCCQHLGVLHCGHAVTTYSSHHQATEPSPWCHHSPYNKSFAFAAARHANSTASSKQRHRLMAASAAATDNKARRRCCCYAYLSAGSKHLSACCGAQAQALSHTLVAAESNLQARRFLHRAV